MIRIKTVSKDMNREIKVVRYLYCINLSLSWSLDLIPIRKITIPPLENGMGILYKFLIFKLYLEFRDVTKEYF